MSDSDKSDQPQPAGQPMLLPAVVNPLAFLEANPIFASGGPPDAAAVLRFATNPDFDGSMAAILKRHEEIDQLDAQLPIVPNEQRVLEKLVWPLRHAKASYMLGHYLATIALGGMVAEMVAILFFEVSPIQIGGKPMDDPAQAKAFGSSFEKLGQERRVNVLEGFSMIDAEAKQAFEVIRTRRRRYLHLWSQGHEQIAADAVAIYSAAVKLVVKVLGLSFSGFAVQLRPELIAYLERTGDFALQPQPEVKQTDAGDALAETSDEPPPAAAG